MHKFLKKQWELDPSKQPAESDRLSGTRWSCQHATCSVVKFTLAAICATLLGIMNTSNAHRVTEAKALSCSGGETATND